MNRNDLDPIMAALATAFLLGPASGWAADPETKDPPAAAGAQREATPMTPGAQSEATSTIPGAPPTPATDERTQLKQALQVGEDKAFYRQTLESEGYKITSVNSEKPDYVEYEVVKGTASYEIQIALNESTGRAEKVDVTPNLWRAKETKQEIRRSAPPPTPATTAPAPITSGDKK